VKVKDVFDRYRPPLKAIFKYYGNYKSERLGCVADRQSFIAAGEKKSLSSKKKSAKDDSMNLDEFKLMVQECAWVDATFSLAHVQSIFHNIQRMEEKDASEANTELVYDEFIEGIAAIAVMKIPNPYVEVDTRIDDFIQSRLFAPLVKLNLIPGLKKACQSKAGAAANRILNNT
jgi:hypothetical protein